MAATSIRPSTLAIFYETTQGTGPVDGGSTWAAQIDNTSGDRIYHYSVDPAGLRQAAVVDERMSDRIFKKATHDPINGLRNGTLTFSIPWHGSEATTAAASQVAETGLMRLLEHSLGAVSRGYSSAITLVNSDTSYNPTTTTGFDEGQCFFIEDDGDQGRLHFARVLTWDGTTATVDRAPYSGVAAADDIHAAAVAYIDQDALKDPADANANTISALVVKDGNVWEAVGGAATLESIEFARGDVPKMNFSAQFAYVRPPGDGAPAEPTWTDTVQGSQPLVIGADLKLHVQNKGTTTLTSFDAISATLTVGVPRLPLNALTESTSRLQGIAGYRTEPADTILEVQVLLSTDWQDDWDAKQSHVVTLYQIGADGKAWAVHGSDAKLMEPPQYSEGEESNLMTLRFEFREDASLDALATDTNRSRSKLLLAMG